MNKIDITPLAMIFTKYYYSGRRSRDYIQWEASQISIPNNLYIVIQPI